MAIQGEREANLEIRRWEHRKSEFGLSESHRKLESLRMELHQAKIILCGELEMRNRLQ